MSWSVQAVGKAAAVAAKIKTECERQNCPEPEQTAKQHICDALAVLLAAYPPEMAVQVAANGSQHVSTPGTATNTMSVSVLPLYGFVD